MKGISNTIFLSTANTSAFDKLAILELAMAVCTYSVVGVVAVGGVGVAVTLCSGLVANIVVAAQCAGVGSKAACGAGGVGHDSCIVNKYLVAIFR